MLERRPLLAVWIWNLLLLLPLAQQEGLSRGLRRDLHDTAHVLALHGQHQVGSCEDGIVDLPRAVTFAIKAVLQQQCLRCCIHPMANQCTEAGGGNVDALPLHALAQHHLGGRAAADVADAHEKNVLEH